MKRPERRDTINLMLVSFPSSGINIDPSAESYKKETRSDCKVWTQDPENFDELVFTKEGEEKRMKNNYQKVKEISEQR